MAMKKGDTSGDELVLRLAMENTNKSQTATELLEALWAGYPVEKLRPLLISEDEEVAFWASYILSELGEKGRELLSTTAKLLDHKLEAVRIDAIDSLLSCSNFVDGATAAAIVSRYSNETDKVRSTIIDFLARAPLSLVQSAPDHMFDAGIKGQHLAGVALFSSASDNLSRMIMGDDEVLRAYALGASIRLHLHAVSIWKSATKAQDAVIAEKARIWFDSVLPD